MSSDIYNDKYYNNYFNGNPYDRNFETIMKFFGDIADYIIKTFNPKRTLDVGCAKGLLVECLRDRGVEAYGFDISEYAISQVREDLKPFVWVQSAHEPIKEKYDLITCIEVLEHIPNEYVDQVIKNITNCTNIIIISSTSSAFDDPTHINIKTNIEWINLFAKYGFVLDYRYNTTEIISKDSFVLCRSEIYNSKLVEENMFIKEKNKQLGYLMTQLQEELNKIYRSKGWKLLLYIYKTKEKIYKIFHKAIKLSRIMHKLVKLFNIVNILKIITKVKSIGIKGTYSLIKNKINSNYTPIEYDSLLCEADISNKIKYLLDKSIKFNIEINENNFNRIDIFTNKKINYGISIMLKIKDINTNKLIRKVTVKDIDIKDDDYTIFQFEPIKDSSNKKYEITIENIGQKGIYVFIDEKYNISDYNITSVNLIKSRIYIKKFFDNICEAWIDKNEPKEKDLITQRNTKFMIEPKISIVVPTYNTPKEFLVDMIESVLDQTYKNWELCIADGGSKNNTRDILKEYALRDSRIKVKLLEGNKGIAGNSNEALSLATGEYIALLDHDDLLPPFALFEVVKVINEKPNVDFIYSDEDKITEDGKKRFDPHFKPDWSPFTLRSYNYITHLSVVKTSLIKKIGGFREGYDGSQDYDLILRATEISKEIFHVPKILYHWRISNNSTALKPETKLYAYESAKKALSDHLERLDINGYVENGPVYGRYNIRYKYEKEPFVSIIIPNKDNIKYLEPCINSIINLTTYKNYEIIICENNSNENKTFEYYNNLSSKYNNIKIIQYKSKFNYSLVNNFAVKYSNGDILLFLNNDIKVISDDWLSNMIEIIMMKDVGIVGAKLLYYDNTIQHIGVVIGMGGVAGHIGRLKNKYYSGHLGNFLVTRNVSAVTGACLMIRKEVFNEVNGFDERFEVAFNDIDLCLKVREKGYQVVLTPYAELYHYESKTRGYEDTIEKQLRFKKEIDLFTQKWYKVLKEGDPYFNKNFDLNYEDYVIKI
ncbi:glycosyltransferase [Caldicellulosiruptoraceae bacterium PP1]